MFQQYNPHRANLSSTSVNTRYINDTDRLGEANDNYSPSELFLDTAPNDLRVLRERNDRTRRSLVRKRPMSMRSLDGNAYRRMFLDTMNLDDDSTPFSPPPETYMTFQPTPNIPQFMGEGLFVHLAGASIYLNEAFTKFVANNFYHTIGAVLGGVTGRTAGRSLGGAIGGTLGGTLGGVTLNSLLPSPMLLLYKNISDLPVGTIVFENHHSFVIGESIHGEGKVRIDEWGLGQVQVSPLRETENFVRTFVLPPNQADARRNTGFMQTEPFMEAWRTEPYNIILKNCNMLSFLAHAKDMNYTVPASVFHTPSLYAAGTLPLLSFKSLIIGMLSPFLFGILDGQTAQRIRDECSKDIAVTPLNFVKSLSLSGPIVDEARAWANQKQNKKTPRDQLCEELIEYLATTSNIFYHPSTVADFAWKRYVGYLRSKGSVWDTESEMFTDTNAMGDPRITQRTRFTEFTMSRDAEELSARRTMTFVYALLNPSLRSTFVDQHRGMQEIADSPLAKVMCNKIDSMVRQRGKSRLDPSFDLMRSILPGWEHRSLPGPMNEYLLAEFVNVYETPLGDEGQRRSPSRPRTRSQSRITRYPSPAPPLV